MIFDTTPQIPELDMRTSYAYELGTSNTSAAIRHQWERVLAHENFPASGMVRCDVTVLASVEEGITFPSDADVILDSPNSVPQALLELESRGFVRKNRRRIRDL